MKKLMIFAALLCASLTAGAAGWTPDLVVSSAFTEDSDLIVLYTSGGAVYTSGCAGNAWIFNASTDARRGRGYATIMAALVSGKKIKMWYQDNCAVWGYHSASAVMLVQ